MSETEFDPEESFRPPVYIVGAGPGDPDLLTLAAFKAIGKAELVLYDRLVSEEILSLIPPAAEAVYVGKLEGEQDQGQALIFRKLVKAINQGRRVVRLKGGDPLVFGRGVEEWQFVKELGSEVRYIPGISSGLAVPGRAGIPMTARGVSSSFIVVTGQLRKGADQDEERARWKNYGPLETIVVLMGVKRREEIASYLIEGGKAANLPVAFIENGTCPRQRIVHSTLEDVAKGKVKVSAPAVFVVGEVCRYSESVLSDLGPAQSFGAEIQELAQSVGNHSVENRK